VPKRTIGPSKAMTNAKQRVRRGAYRQLSGRRFGIAPKALGRLRRAAADEQQRQDG